MKIYEKTKNLGNIRILTKGNWMGTIGEVDGFAKFESVALGNRALIKQLQKYLARKVDTITEIINVYCPPSDKRNNTPLYINNVVKWSGIPPNKKIIFGSDDFKKIFAAIIRQETQVIVKPEAYNEALAARTSTPIYQQSKKNILPSSKDILGKNESILPILAVLILIYIYV